MSKEFSQPSREVLTATQQAFADYIAERVKSVENAFRDTRDYREAKFRVDPVGQLVPITGLELARYERIMAPDETEEDVQGPVPYMVWKAKLDNDELGVETSLYLTTHEGFTYRGYDYAFKEKMSDEFGKSMLNSLLRAEETGLITPILGY